MMQCYNGIVLKTLSGFLQKKFSHVKHVAENVLLGNL
ncbi:hypothetical protein J2Y45_004565 [Dyadobacter sp. BE34]|uniref:Uncharacterized protein n=1 Tax=Dyadobacter fermentans TaxID=94254 RepID=A0ABU1R122_9BACT|nr:hypothetical protein [Dyadobacter fermentans]MDR7044842.1 hypothetical protein [Dyadobacter sp. BE242]MDR7199422.1 hypothetical protein [Dyadobacter sp. BE34]MDR7217382.1 hypothetical protein [Dyadobacter sp. BE31]MDR7265314.1 hypothetical protein [Dyadobacter sp. BE32]